VTGPSIVCFRDDLRIADNPALQAAAERGEPVLAVYILDEVSPDIRPLGGASKWWLHHSLTALTAALARIGVPLILRRGAAAQIITDLVATTEAGAVFWNRRYGMGEREVDAGLKASLKAAEIDVRSFGANVLFEPWTLQTGQGGPYRVFTPFYRACLSALEPRHPIAGFTSLDGYLAPGTGLGTAAESGSCGLASDDLASWSLTPSAPDWSTGLAETWTPGEAGATARLAEFLADDLVKYVEEHDLPARNSTSKLSPHLRFGEISPFQIWHEVRRGAGRGKVGGDAFLRQLVWRDYGYHLLFHYPEITHTNIRPAFDHFPWNEPTPAIVAAWQQGETGIPLVDAGMRELWQTGTMHNRVRMVTASFLVKNLLLDWRIGEAFFWDTLVDADPSSNAMNWQWVAGTGVDAAPYFRVFNPELQATRFDPNGEYVATYVPEAGSFGYTQPLVDLKESRQAALDAYSSIKGL
jgi:deoxyribodipyrimidine photo-lyase